MEELFLKALVLTYSATGIISLIGYWPTIKDLHRHKKPSANISSYILWSCTYGIAFFYSIFILPDLPLRIVSGINFAACLTVLVLTIGLKRTLH